MDDRRSTGCVARLDFRLFTRGGGNRAAHLAFGRIDFRITTLVADDVGGGSRFSDTLQDLIIGTGDREEFSAGSSADT